MIDHQRFIEMINSEFPDALANIDAIYGRGILHVETAQFREATEAALDAGNASIAEKHFRFIESVLNEADAAVTNAIEVSYLEDLTLGEFTRKRYLIVKERMLRSLREMLVSYHANWK